MGMLLLLDGVNEHVKEATLGHVMRPLDFAKNSQSNCPILTFSTWDFGWVYGLPKGPVFH
jgi:hypothetical protein